MADKRDALMTPANEVYKDVNRSWNQDGYRTKLKPGIQVLEVPLGNIVAADPYRDEIIRIEMRDGTPTLEVLHGFPPVNFTANVPFRLSISTVHAFADGVDVTDIRLSAETNYLYLLDASRSCIYRLDLQTPQDARGRVQQIPLVLPRGIVLDSRSRLEIVPRDELRVEKKDASFFISCASASVILKVDSETGNSSVHVGLPNRPGETKEDSERAKALLRSPSALYYDDQTQMLFWADSEARGIFALKNDQVVEIVRLDYEVRIESLLVYRIQDHIDSLVLDVNKDQVGTQFWPGEPALLVMADSLARKVSRIRLHSAKRSPKPVIGPEATGQAVGAERSLRRLMCLRNGDLIVTTSSAWSYHVLQERQKESEYHQNGFVS